MQSSAQLRANAALLIGTIAVLIALAALWIFSRQGSPEKMQVAEILASAESLTIYVAVLLLFQFVLPWMVMMSVAFAIPVRHLHAARVGLVECVLAMVVYLSYVVTWMRLIYG